MMLRQIILLTILCISAFSCDTKIFVPCPEIDIQAIKDSIVKTIPASRIDSVIITKIEKITDTIFRTKIVQKLDTVFVNRIDTIKINTPLEKSFKDSTFYATQINRIYEKNNKVNRLILAYKKDSTINDITVIDIKLLDTIKSSLNCETCGVRPIKIRFRTFYEGKYPIKFEELKPALEPLEILKTEFNDATKRLSYELNRDTKCFFRTAKFKDKLKLKEYSLHSTKAWFNGANFRHGITYSDLNLGDFVQQKFIDEFGNIVEVIFEMK